MQSKTYEGGLAMSDIKEPYVVDPERIGATKYPSYKSAPKNFLRAATEALKSETPGYVDEDKPKKRWNLLKVFLFAGLIWFGTVFVWATFIT